MHVQKIKHADEKKKCEFAPYLIFCYFLVLLKQKHTYTHRHVWSSHPCSRPNTNCLKKKNSCCRAKPIKLKQHYSSLNCMSQIPDTTGIQKTLKISGKLFTKMGSILGEAKNVIYVQCCEIVKYVCMYVINLKIPWKL